MEKLTKLWKVDLLSNNLCDEFEESIRLKSKSCIQVFCRQPDLLLSTESQQNRLSIRARRDLRKWWKIPNWVFRELHRRCVDTRHQESSFRIARQYRNHIDKILWNDLDLFSVRRVDKLCRFENVWTLKFCSKRRNAPREPSNRNAKRSVLRFAERSNDKSISNLRRISRSRATRNKSRFYE